MAPSQGKVIGAMYETQVALGREKLGTGVLCMLALHSLCNQIYLDPCRIGAANPVAFRALGMLAP